MIGVCKSEVSRLADVLKPEGGTYSTGYHIEDFSAGGNFRAWSEQIAIFC